MVLQATVLRVIETSLVDALPGDGHAQSAKETMSMISNHGCLCQGFQCA